MSTTSHQVLQLLTSGKYLSGQDIGRQLGISRMAVSKAVKRLGACDVPIRSTTGKGYRLQREIQLLDSQRIEELLNRNGHSKCRPEILEVVPSTSDYLLEMKQNTDHPLSVCLAEKQAQGRGRRERSWVATPYRNITMSIGWQFDSGMADLAGLGVAAGITIVQILQEFGLDREIGLKWPNDIVWQDRKLGGLLIDVRGEHDGPCRAVLGLGLNLSLSDADAEAIDQPFATLETIHEGKVDRNALAAALISGLADMFEKYPETGFSPWYEKWTTFDRLLNRPVVVLRGGREIAGTALGINDQGGLNVMLDDGKAANFFSGEVSLRLR